MTKKLKITIALIAFIIIIAGATVWFFTSIDKQPTNGNETIGEIQNEKVEDAMNLRYSEPELRAMVTETAKEQFGEDAFIIFLSSEGPTILEINGVKRNIYIYAADSRSVYDKTGEIRGLYHVDADTGEIFDNGNGNMEKIKAGE